MSVLDGMHTFIIPMGLVSGGFKYICSESAHELSRLGKQHLKIFGVKISKEMKKMCVASRHEQLFWFRIESTNGLLQL